MILSKRIIYASCVLSHILNRFLIEFYGLPKKIFKGLSFSCCFNAVDDSLWQGKSGVINGCNCSITGR